MLTVTIVLALLTVLVATDEAANTAHPSGQHHFRNSRNRVPHKLVDVPSLPPAPSSL